VAVGCGVTDAETLCVGAEDAVESAGTAADADAVALGDAATPDKDGRASDGEQETNNAAAITAADKRCITPP
jgi:hypothetical protein